MRSNSPEQNRVYFHLLRFPGKTTQEIGDDLYDQTCRLARLSTYRAAQTNDPEKALSKIRANWAGRILRVLLKKKQIKKTTLGANMRKFGYAVNKKGE